MVCFLLSVDAFHISFNCTIELDNEMCFACKTQCYRDFFPLILSSTSTIFWTALQQYCFHLALLQGNTKRDKRNVYLKDISWKEALLIVERAPIVWMLTPSLCFVAVPSLLLFFLSRDRTSPRSRRVHSPSTYKFLNTRYISLIYLAVSSYVFSNTS